MVLFWSLFALLAVSVVIGLAGSMSLYERIAGRGAGADLDRLVRESW